ncbi:MAG TPA: type II toxin-antitoxin system HigB family toxin [Mucilaginibacter sp.]
MNVIAKPTIIYYTKKYPVAATALLSWYKDILEATFHSFNELKSVYQNASIVGNNRVVFNIKGNSFRLIVSFDLKRQALYVIWFGTHHEYDKIDAATVPYIEI